MSDVQSFSNTWPDSSENRPNISDNGNSEKASQTIILTSRLVSTQCPMGIYDGTHAEYDTTWTVTQVGLMGDKAGLGGNDDGVSVVDDEVEEASILI